MEARRGECIPDAGTRAGRDMGLRHLGLPDPLKTAGSSHASSLAAPDFRQAMPASSRLTDPEPLLSLSPLIFVDCKCKPNRRPQRMDHNGADIRSVGRFVVLSKEPKPPANGRTPRSGDPRIRPSPKRDFDDGGANRHVSFRLRRRKHSRSHSYVFVRPLKAAGADIE